MGLVESRRGSGFYVLAQAPPQRAAAVSPGIDLKWSLIWPERAFMVTPTAGGIRVGGVQIIWPETKFLFFVIQQKCSVGDVDGSSLAIGIRSRSGMSQVCDAFDADIVFSEFGHERRQACRVIGVRHLMGDEAEKYLGKKVVKKDTKAANGPTP